MQLFRVTLRLTSPLGTPLVSPMLFGQLCWIVAETDGQEAMAEWLNPERMWRISDGFPKGYLPKPLTKPRILTAEQLLDAKLRKKASLVSRQTWLDHRKEWDETRVPIDEHSQTPLVKRAHNTIDRKSGQVIEPGGLYFAYEDWSYEKNLEIDLYVETEDEEERIQQLLSALGRNGYGRDSSTGRGQFVVSGMSRDLELSDIEGPSRRMSLSRGILTPETMRDALWRMEPHFGRAGPQTSLTGHSPFKRPVLLTRPGATFSAAGTAGRWITGVHAEKPEIGLNGLHVSIPFQEAA